MDSGLSHRILANASSYIELFCFVLDHLMPEPNCEYMEEEKTMIETIIEQKKKRELIMQENGDSMDPEEAQFPASLRLQETRKEVRLRSYS